MRWQRLAQDLDAQLEAEHRAEQDVQVGELARAEHAAVTLVDRFRSVAGRAITVTLVDGSVVMGTVLECAAEWVSVDSGRATHLVPRASIALVEQLGAHSVPASSARDVGLSRVLREIMRDRVVVVLRSTAGERVGRVARVGADHLDLVALTPVEGGPRSGGHVVVPYSALVVLSENR